MYKKFCWLLIIIAPALLFSGCSVSQNKTVNTVTKSTEDVVIQNNSSTSDVVVADGNSMIDSDGDGLSDYDEINTYKSDPQKADSDGDGYNDGDEVKSGYDPLGSGKLINASSSVLTVSAPEIKDLPLPGLCNVTGIAKNIEYLHSNTQGTVEFMETENLYLVTLKISGSSELPKTTVGNPPCSKIIGTEQNVIVAVNLNDPNAKKIKALLNQKIKANVNYNHDYLMNANYYYSFDQKIIDKNNTEIDLSTFLKESNYKEIVSPASATTTPPAGTCDDKCYWDLAVSKKDDSICYKIKENNTNLRGCLVAVSFYKGSEHPCDVLKVVYPGIDIYWEECYRDMAVSKKDDSICYNIKDDDRLRSCLASVSFDKNNTVTESNAVADRDSRTISDLKIIQVALEMYYNDNGKYPSSLADAKKYMNEIPVAVSGTTAACANSYQYNYTYIRNDDYSLTYCLDGNSDASKGFVPGVGKATPQGLK